MRFAIMDICVEKEAATHYAGNAFQYVKNVIVPYDPLPTESD